MTSERQVRANRANAKVSTGPRTKLGKARTALNALNHGLSIPASRDPATQREVDAIIRQLVGYSTDPAQLQIAGLIAEAEIDLRRVRRCRAKVIERVLDEDSPEKRDFLTSFREGEKRRVDAGAVVSPGARLQLLAESCRDLSSIDRYERRALSRRKFAIREFVVARANPEPEG